MQLPGQCYPVLRESVAATCCACPAALCKHRQCSRRWRASAASANGNEANDGNQEELEAAMEEFLKTQTERESGAWRCLGGRMQAPQCVTSLQR